MLDVLRSVLQEVNRAGDLEAVLGSMVERVKDAMSTEVCSIYLHDEHDERFVFMATRGLNTDAVGKVSLALNSIVAVITSRVSPCSRCFFTRSRALFRMMGRMR